MRPSSQAEKMIFKGRTRRTCPEELTSLKGAWSLTMLGRRLRGAAPLLQSLPELAQCARQDLMNVCRAQAEDLGDLLAAEIAAEAQGEHLAIAVAEARQSRLEAGLDAHRPVPR